MTAEFSIRRRQLPDYKRNLRRWDKQNFDITMHIFGYNKDWDLTIDGDLVARCTSRERLLRFAGRQGWRQTGG